MIVLHMKRLGRADLQFILDKVTWRLAGWKANIFTKEDGKC